MLKNNLLRGAVNRIYYAMFYMLLALALKYEFTTSKHGQLIGWFNKNFIKHEAFDFRQQGDYGIFTELVLEDVENKFNLMNKFISVLSDHILKK